MRDLIPPALTRAPPSYGACGGARTGTRTRPQRRYAPIAQDCTGSPQRRRSRQPVGRIRAGTLSLLYRPLQTFTEEIAPRYPGNRPHARPCVRRSVKLYTLDRKPRPKPARSQRENPYTLRKRRLLFFAADQTITPIFCSWRFFRIQHSKRAHSRASRDSVRAFGASSRVPAKKTVRAVFYVFMPPFFAQSALIVARGACGAVKTSLRSQVSKTARLFLGIAEGAVFDSLDSAAPRAEPSVALCAQKTRGRAEHLFASA